MLKVADVGETAVNHTDLRDGAAVCGRGVAVCGWRVTGITACGPMFATSPVDGA